MVSSIINAGKTWNPSGSGKKTELIASMTWVRPQTPITPQTNAARAPAELALRQYRPPTMTGSAPER